MLIVVPLVMTLLIIAAAGMAPRAAAHRTATTGSVLPAVQYPRYYDGNMTRAVDTTVHPEDPPGTYRINTHYDACEQFKAAPSVRASLSNADLVADGLLPRNAFATLADWERSVLNATTRVCDSYQLYWTATGAPAVVNDAPSVNSRHPLDPPNPDCYCYKPESQPNYAGFVADGQTAPTQHVAQYAYSWAPDLVEGPKPVPSVSADSIWVGGSGLFTINGQKEVLMQTGIEDWWLSAGVQTHALFWECINPAHIGVAPCDGAQFWWPKKGLYIGDEITMYTSGNFYWSEDDTQNAVQSDNRGPLPALDSSEWITEAPNNGTSNYPLADFHNTGQANMHWMDQKNSWWDANNGDSDYLTYTMANPPDDPPSHILAYDGTAAPYYINSTWGYG